MGESEEESGRGESESAGESESDSESDGESGGESGSEGGEDEEPQQRCWGPLCTSVANEILNHKLETSQDTTDLTEFVIGNWFTNNAGFSSS